MEEQRRQADERFINHEKRLIDIETKVESLHYHHRQDRLQERMNDIESVVVNIEKLLAKKNGNGELGKRVIWVEKIIWMAIGGFAAIEFYIRVIK
jgi:hypothetical protein